MRQGSGTENDAAQTAEVAGSWEPAPIACPNCGETERQIRSGKQDGVQRYRCTRCSRRYIAERQHRGYPDALRQRAVEMYQSGRRITHIARELNLNPPTVLNWVRDAETSSGAPTPPTPAEPAPTEIEAGPQLGTMAPVVRHRTTIIDVAREAGVSISTVSNYLNRKGRMSDDTRARIERVMDALQFVPSTRPPGRQRSNTIGLLCFGLNNMSAPDNPVCTLLAGLHTAATDKGYNVLNFLWERPRRYYVPPMGILEANIDGLIWVGPLVGEPQMVHIAAAGLPTMALMSRKAPPGIGYIASDNVGGIVKVVHHLHGLGHRRIAYIGALVSSDFRERLEGYRKGLEQVGLPWDPALVGANAMISTNWMSGRTRDYEVTVARWLRLERPPTAIITTTDGWAEWMILHLQSLGTRVPEDIAVTGFDDTLIASTFPGGITTLRQDTREMGRLGVERLFRLMDGDPVENCRITLPVNLIVRGSTVTGVSPAAHG